jgi:hypothetical protein
VDARPDRTRALVEAGIALSSELSLDAVLPKVVEAASGLTGARYAALGVLGGRVTVESRPEAGTTFVVEAPL